MATRSRLGQLFGALLPNVNRQNVKPFSEQGGPGYTITGGYINQPEKSPKLSLGQRELTVADMMANISIIAASTRYFVNLVSKSTWQVRPVYDLGDDKSSDEAKRAAELVERAMYDMAVSWTRLIRRTAMYRFHGFAIQEWTAKRDKDGTILYKSVDSRPQHTINRWDIDENGNVIGVAQTLPQTGQECYLPRGKIIYLVDDALTDYPDGMGVFRHLVEPSQRLKSYLRLEGIGFERDMRGIPIGRAPFRELQDAVNAGKMSQADADAYTRGIQEFVKLQNKGVDSSITLDSTPYENKVGDGTTFTSTMKWGLDLIRGVPPGFSDLNTAITRVNQDMARIIGTEHLMLGGDKGSYALSEDKSRNLFLQVEATLSDIAETFETDFIEPLFNLNGIDHSLKPSLEPEALQFRDFAEIAGAVRDLATAGAVIPPDDPLIDDVRSLMGVSLQPELDALLTGEIADDGV